MIVRKLALACFCLVAIPALAASSLPPKMEGQRHTNGGRTNKVEAELIQMESPNKAKIKATYWDGCTRSGETSAEFKDGAWQFTIPGSVKCEDIAVVVRPVDGKTGWKVNSKLASGMVPFISSGNQKPNPAVLTDAAR